MELGGWIRQLILSKELKQQHIALLGEIVAALVGMVNVTLNAGQVLIGGARGSSGVFGVPEFEIGQVLFRNSALKAAEGSTYEWGLAMPSRSALVMQCCDLR